MVRETYIATGHALGDDLICGSADAVLRQVIFGYDDFPEDGDGDQEVIRLHARREHAMVVEHNYPNLTYEDPDGRPMPLPPLVIAESYADIEPEVIDGGSYFLLWGCADVYLRCLAQLGYVEIIECGAELSLGEGSTGSYPF